ncbi:hypothetical protein Tco_1346017, partial [Tanacetum coccineum]
MPGFLNPNPFQMPRFGINKWYQSFALRNFDLEDMELESTNSGPTAKLPILKLVPQTTQENGITVTKMSTPATAEEKTNKKNDVKARGLLLMALPNEHQLTFSQYPDAKSMFASIETRFGESLDSIFNRLQKIVSRLAILGVIIAQEDLNLKFLSSLPPEWNSHVVAWMNKPEGETMSIDDLYNNFKIIEQKVKKTVGTSSGGQNLAFMTAPSTISTNDANIACPQVSAASLSVNAASPQVCTASVSDNTMYAFMVENPNVLHQDLEQIHEDDLEATDLKWQLSLLSMRAKKECRAPRSKDGQFRNPDNTRKQGNNEDTSSKAMLAIDGVGFDWSDMEEEQVQTNMALMAFLDSKVYTDKTCSKTYLKNYETLKKQCDDLLVKLNESEFKAATYKRGLTTVEAQLITYRKNGVLFSEEVVVLKREVAYKNYEINVLKSELEKIKQEKDGIDFKIENFDKASKDLDQLLGSQITDKSKKGLGYSAVPPPHPLIYNRPNKLDLSYSGLDEFKEPEFKGYGPKDNVQESNVVCDKESENSKENYVESLINCHNHQRGNNYNRSVLRNMSPKAVLLKTGLTPLNTVRPVNTAQPKTAVYSAKSKTRFSKQAQSTANRPFYKQTTLTRRSVHVAKRHYYTGRYNAVNTTRSFTRQVNAVRGKLQHDDKGFVDSGCSMHMTGNITYLSDFKEFDRGYVAFGRGAYGGKITGKGTLKTDNLDFEDVYFVNELKFNLFSVSQMCDKKNYVPFTDTECLVLSPNFKLPDENQILLKIPRKDNMYIFDMKNIVPKESLTCLVAKATLDESMLWHRRLGH